MLEYLKLSRVWKAKNTFLKKGARNLVLKSKIQKIFEYW